ncbi:MAG: aspartyl protease family protein [Sphingomonadales bacterium]|nr:aspartyl protease family protein [Sphingomonadales bacterium]MBK6718453.1 aspartyl protease family protein [Sphingomonadales bacterium]MBK9588201.1 aspartyl protease family protein [Sphingomonadales bacterium]MBL0117344.1 aspartyl protease family protein [Sphingomonadales bacterium]
MAQISISRAILPLLAMLATPVAAETGGRPPALQTPAADEVATGLDRSLRMTVPVMINGQGPFDFVVDTGADRTVISEELAKQLNLPQSGTATLHAMGGSAKVKLVSIKTVQVSTNIAKRVEAAALPRRNVGADGLLGIDSLKNQRIVMNFQSNTMRVEPASVPEEAVPEDSDLIIVTAKTRLGQLVMVDADANGQKIWVVVDTGAQNSIANTRLRALLVKRVPETEIKSISMVDVLGRTTPAEYTIVSKLRIGGVSMGNAAIAFADAHPFRLFGLTRKPSMLLGVESLRSFRRVSVDFATRKVKFLLPEEG